MTTEQHADVIDYVATPDDTNVAHTLRQARQKIAESIQAAYDALFGEESPALSQFMRFRAAGEVAQLTGQTELSAFYADQTARATISDKPAAVLEQAILTHVQGVTMRPDLRTQDDLEQLAAAGLTQSDIIALSQLIGFVAFQARIVAGVRALCGKAATDSATTIPAFDIRPGFTVETIEWSSWLAPLDIASASAEQLAVLDESGPHARKSPYYLTLIHNAKVLQKRSETYNAVMYAPGGLSRVDREMSALVVSVINGCHYCASVHAQRLNQLSRRTDLSAQVLIDPLAATLSPRELAVARFAARLTLAAGQVNENDLTALREQNISDAEILDLIHVVAIFGWANRLMLTLGQPAEKLNASGANNA